jgi:hypothetical protein
MPLSDGGSDVALVRNSLNGLFELDWDDGNPVFDDSEAHTVLSLVLEWQAKWWADPTGKRGSRLPLLLSCTSVSGSLLTVQGGPIAGVINVGDRVFAGGPL